MKEESAFASIEEAIKLPSLLKISREDRIFQPIINVRTEDGYELSQPLLEKTNHLVSELNQTFYVFQNAKYFNFSFPESMFPPLNEGERNKIRYEQKMITEQENTFKDRLSEEQLKQIEELGEFKVKSNVQYITLPYVWKINQTFFWGKKKIHEVWLRSLAAIYGYFWTAGKLISSQIPRQLHILKKIPVNIFSILFGAKTIKTMVSVQYPREIFKDFWSKLMKEHYTDSEEWFSALWNYLYVYYDPELARPIEPSYSEEERKKRQNHRNNMRYKFDRDLQATRVKEQTIMNAQNNFNQQWGKLRKKLILEITEEVNEANNLGDHKAESEQDLLMKEGETDTDEKILQQLSERKFSLYLQHLQTQLPKVNVSLNIINAIVLILRLFNVIGAKEKKVSKERERKRQLTENKIRAQHRIKSLFPPFFRQMVDAQMKVINKSLDEEMHQSLLTDTDFRVFLSKDQLEAYKDFLKFRLSEDLLIEAKKLKVPEYHGPSRIFYSNYPLIPPYKIIKEGSQYSLKRVSDDITVTTSTYFWKLKLYWMRLKTWTINCLVFLSFSVWKGPVGLRCLWGIDDFNYDMSIHYSEGTIYYQSRPTVIGTFKTVLKGITQSRHRFEAMPDLGLLGKNVSRIFNYIECYLFRFLFVGVILVLIGYPILIIVASAVTLTLVVSVWAWIPVVLAVTYLFNILIKQFETGEDVYGFWSRTFPLLRVVLRILLSALIMLGVILNLILLSPLRSLFMFIFCGLQNLLRRTLDKIMMFVFRHLGRTPSRDTAVCRKISGPGMSKEFYMSINEEDVYVLLRASLEKKYMNKFNEIIVSKIEENGNSFRKIMDKVLEAFSVSFTRENTVLKNTNHLLQNYRRSYSAYMNRYPNNPHNVRFTQEEIDNYFQNTVNIVKNFVDKNRISKWIFEKYELYEDMYDDLTRCLWMEIFNCGQEIFEPLQKLDTRFKLQDQYNDQDGFNKSMKKGVGMVMKSLEGEVEIRHHHKKLTPFKHNLLSREHPTQQVDQVFNLWRSNSVTNINLYRDNLRSLFVPNLGIKEIIIVDDETRVRDIKAQSKVIIDL